MHDTHRLALMNAMLHDIEGKILLADTLSNLGKQMSGYDVVLTNPHFGTKKGGERATQIWMICMYTITVAVRYLRKF